MDQVTKTAIKYWGDKVYSKLWGQVRKVIKMNNATKSKERLSYARVLMEIELNQALPELIFYCNEHEIIT